MPTADDTAVMGIYRSLMEEAMVRCTSIDAMLRFAPGLRPQFVREYCYLQLRLICELIALGCLLCHGDMPATKTKALQKSWKPEEILSSLELLHPDFYPKPHIQVEVPGGFHLDEYDKPYLTKEDLITLWSKSGDFLHKGNLRKMLKSKDTTVPRVDDIISWNQKIINLIERHKISRIGNNLHFLVFMNNEVFEKSYNISVQVAIAESPG